jgi:hypothetical protein
MAKPRDAEHSVTAAQAAAFRLRRQHLDTNAATERTGTNGVCASTTINAETAEHAEKFSASRSSREASSARSVVEICRATGGIQAQVQSAAELSIWTRRRETTRDDIRRALWDRREIVKTSAMRLTLHLIPARDLAIYIAALKPMAMGTLQRWQARIGATPSHVRAMVETVVDSIGDEPQTQQQLIARAKKKAGKAVRSWLDHAWSAVRPAVIEGRLVYGPPRGAEATFVRVDRWLGRQPALGVEEARAELLRRFLAAFGPATPHDFAKWSGIRTSEAKRLVESADDLARVSVDGAPGWILRKDVATLTRSELNSDAVRLLGAFDSFLLAHATKEHLVDARFYKRVYRPQGWISPVVLRGGTVIGVWFPESTGKKTTLGVELFGRATPSVRRAIEREAEQMSTFLGTACSPRFR